MLGNVYHAFDHHYELYVEESGGRYLIVMNVYTESEPQVLHECATKEGAIEACQQFPKLYRTAIQRGFELNGQFFEHPDGKSVHISFALQPATSVDKFMKVLL